MHFLIPVCSYTYLSAATAAAAAPTSRKALAPLLSLPAGTGDARLHSAASTPPAPPPLLAPPLLLPSRRGSSPSDAMRPTTAVPAAAAADVPLLTTVSLAAVAAAVAAAAGSGVVLLIVSVATVLNVGSCVVSVVAGLGATPGALGSRLGGLERRWGASALHTIHTDTHTHTHHFTN